MPIFSLLLIVEVWESSGVVRFDLWPLLKGQTRIAKFKIAYIACSLLVLEVCNVKPTYR